MMCEAAARAALEQRSDADFAASCAVIAAMCAAATENRAKTALFRLFSDSELMSCCFKWMQPNFKGCSARCRPTWAGALSKPRMHSSA